jgi:hypothetical protein
MKSLYLWAGVGLCLLLISFGGRALNQLGFMARRSVLWRGLSVLMLIAVAGLMFAACEIEPESPFALTLTVGAGSHEIEKIAIAKVPIALDLMYSKQTGDIVFFKDAKGREYVARVPSQLPSGTNEASFVPTTTQRGWAYLIRPLGSVWLVLGGPSGTILVDSCAPVGQSARPERGYCAVFVGDGFPETFFWALHSAQ